MNQFEIATKELVSTEVSQFFGVVQGKWNRHMEVATLNLIEEEIAAFEDDEIKDLLIKNKDFFKDSHEKFAYKSLLEVLNFLKVLDLQLAVDKGELVLVTTKTSEDEVLDQLESLFNFISNH